MTSSAILSPCGTYRYRLDRRVLAGPGKVFAWFGINPSTADHTIDDQTVKKWRGFTLKFGGVRFIAGNVFAFRHKNVDKVACAADPFGPDNTRHLHEIIGEADVLIPCWGAREKVPPRLQPELDEFMLMLLASGKPVMCLGVTASGDPRHPQMLGYDTPLVPWVPR